MDTKVVKTYGPDRHLRSVWHAMLNRCNNPTHKHFHNYGGRGINVCVSWHKFDAFKNWSISNGYKRGLQLDRRNNNLGYFPDNCRFVSRIENMRNRRNTVIWKINGFSKPAVEWCQIFGLSYNVVYMRLKLGWPIHKAMLDPIGNASQNRIKIDRKLASN